jgi:putative transposase
VRSRRISTIFMVRRCRRKRCPGLPIRSPEEMEEWSHRPLDPVYVAIFIDAIVVTVRQGQVANRPVYAAIGVTLEGRKDVLGLTMGTGGGEGAKF